MGFLGGVVGGLTGGMATGGISALAGNQFFNGSGGQSPAYSSAPPQLPGYNATSFAPASPYQSFNDRVAQPNINTQGLEQLRGLATGSTNPWVDQQLAQEDQSAQTQGNQVRQQNATGTAQAQNNLAMGQGLTSGAAERVQTQGNNNLQNNLQNLGAQSQGRKLAINTAGRQQQIGALEQLPGQEIQAAAPGTQVSEFNAGLGQANTQGQNQFNLSQNQLQNAYTAQNAAAQNQYNLTGYGINSKIWGDQQLGQNLQDTENNRSWWEDIF